MEPFILLPESISVMRPKSGQDSSLPVDVVEFSMYYKNIIHPYTEEYDIKIDCEYGKNLGFCWRLDCFDSCPDEFPLTLKIYLYGQLIAEKATKIDLVARDSRPISILCIGDSMTQEEYYVLHTAERAENIKMLGTRNIKNARHEGRGGLTLQSYLENYKNKGWFTSPFLFPVSIDGDKYYGDLSFWESVRDNPNTYTTVGFEYHPIKNGMYALVGDSLCLYSGGEYKEVDPSPVFSFDFEKYLVRNGIDTPDIVTLLFGANDLQMTSYENTPGEIEKMLIRLEKMITDIKKCGTKIVINLPICGADQYSWGSKCGCRGTVKQYDYNIKLWSKAILDAYDGRESDGIYICPMLAVIDNYAGFPIATSPLNMYTERQITHLNNWVHPNENGYKQMGDALAATITKVRRTL